MTRKSPKKTLGGSTAQTLFRTAHIDQGQLRIRDRAGITYHAQRTPEDHLCVTMVGGFWSGVLQMNAWTKAELAWWEAQVDALTDPQQIFLVVSEGFVTGHLQSPELAAPGATVHAFRVNNAANAPVPALGAHYAPPPEVVRPPRMRGPSKAL